MFLWILIKKQSRLIENQQNKPTNNVVKIPIQKQLINNLWTSYTPPKWRVGYTTLV